MKFFSPQVLKHALTGFAGKHQVENDGIVDTLFSEERTGFAVGGMIDCQPGLAQRGNNICRKPLLVFNQEYAHQMTT